MARREIGILTTNKINPRQHKILVPANPERAIKYIRKPIDYSLLDDVGHGVKLPQHQQGVRVTTGKRGSLTGVNGASGLLPAPTTKPPTPPQSGRTGLGMGSLSRGSKEYRTPAPPIPPPQVPSNYAPNYPLGHPRANDSLGTLSRRGSNYSTLPLGTNYSSQTGISRQNSGTYGTLVGPSGHYNQGPQTPPTVVGMVHPMAQNGQQHPSQQFMNPIPTPPPPPPPSHQQTMIPASVSNLSESLPDPPSHLRSHSFDRMSPPLPPPPPSMDEGSSAGASSENDWIPKKYLEKVIAIYDYAAQRYDELSFQENSVIYVIKKNDDGWYEGVLGGITGLFPGNYVEPCM